MRTIGREELKQRETYEHGTCVPFSRATMSLRPGKYA